ncbi:glycosyltransferase [Leptospira yasudae]|nr:glycosyltransferase [Leptospira yasudae]
MFLIRILIKIRTYLFIFKRNFFRREKYNFSKSGFSHAKTPKILHLSTFDNSGGASRAAYKLHKALVANGFSSRMLVYRKYSQDDTIIEATEKSGFRWLYDRFLNLAYHFLYVRRFHTEANILHSPQRVSRISLKKHLEILKPDIVHIHWIGFNFISIEDLSQINVPVVWTVHDMWSFCGAEHVSFDERFKNGYLKNNRPNTEKGFDLNRWVWERKRKAYEKLKITLIGVSDWMCQQIRSSELFGKRAVIQIPNIIEIENFNPQNRDFCRTKFSLSPESKILLFGAEYFDSNKGFDLLKAAVELYLNKYPDSNAQFVSFGGKDVDWKDLGVDVVNVGYIQNDIELAQLYSAADVTLIPSRLESFCQIAAESIACGTPVVCFRTSGLKDIVQHLKTGYLADPFSIHDFAMGIQSLLQDRSDLFSIEEMTEAIRENFTEEKVLSEHIQLYSNLLNI